MDAPNSTIIDQIHNFLRPESNAPAQTWQFRTLTVEDAAKRLRRLLKQRFDGELSLNRIEDSDNSRACLVISGQALSEKISVEIRRFEGTESSAQFALRIHSLSDTITDEQRYYVLVIADLSNAETGAALTGAMDSLKQIGGKRIVVVEPGCAIALLGPQQPERQVNAEIISDKAIDDDGDDLLRFADYADALALLIQNPATKPPLTIAINAPWGAGKTSLAKMVARRLDQKRSHGSESPNVTFWFNAWMHDDANHLTTAFTATLARKLDAHRPLWRRLFNPLPWYLADFEMRRKRFFVWFGLILAGILAGYVSGIPWSFSDLSASDLGLPGSGLLGIPALYFAIRFAFGAASSVRDYVRDPKRSAGLGTIENVRRQLKKLIRQAIPGDARLIVFIDDLERCRPPRPIELLELINQLLRHKQVIVVVVADIPAVAACAAIEYEKIAAIYDPEKGAAPGPREKGGIGYGRYYIQKMVQLQFDLPSHPLIENGVPRWESLGRARPAAVDEGAEAKTTLIDSLKSLAGEVWSHKIPRLGLPLRRYIVRGSAVGRLFVVPLWIGLYPGFWYAAVGARLGFPLRSRDDSIAPPGGLGLWAVLLPAFGVLSLVLLASVAVVGKFSIPVLLGTDPILGIPWTTKLVGLPFFPDISLRRASFYALSLLMLSLFPAIIGFIVGIASRRKTNKRIRHVEANAGAIEEVSEDKRGNLLEALPAGDRAGVVAFLARQNELSQFNDSEQVRAALKTTRQFAADQPRSDKRLLNRLRLFVNIAARRGLLQGKGALTAGQIGKWVVLQERWPELAQIIARNPGGAQLATLENAANNGKLFAREIAPYLRAGLDGRALENFLLSGPKLGKVQGRLVRFA